LRIDAGDDLTGAEVGAAVKSVLAIAPGIYDGLGIGESAGAALVARGLARMTRLGLGLGGRKETFMGLSGVGDVILTCIGNQSRNRHVGLWLAAGHSLSHSLKELS
jgi:glycerol-3-phosphate dehydrogenase (NAD(P)+)